jgi:hypothetical protein
MELNSSVPVRDEPNKKPERLVLKVAPHALHSKTKVKAF